MLTSPKQTLCSPSTGEEANHFMTHILFTPVALNLPARPSVTELCFALSWKMPSVFSVWHAGLLNLTIVLIFHYSLPSIFILPAWQLTVICQILKYL